MEDTFITIKGNAIFQNITIDQIYLFNHHSV